MKLTLTRKAQAIIPTASMADIAFLLIIFFMVTTTYDVDRTRVDLPLSTTRVEVERGAAYVVLAKESMPGGRETMVYKFSDGKQMSRVVSSSADIWLEASRIIHQDPIRQFIVKADADVRYALVDDLMDQLRKAGVQRLLLLTVQRGEG
jgi:biopolymer transport protein ExbD